MRCQTGRCANHGSSMSMIARAASCSPKSGRPLPLWMLIGTIELLAQLPQRLVVRVPERCEPRVRRHGRQQDAAEHAHVLASPAHLGDRVVEVVEEDLHDAGRAGRAPARRSRRASGCAPGRRPSAGRSPRSVGSERGEVALREERRDRVREQHLGVTPSCSAPARRRVAVPVAVRGRREQVGERVLVGGGPRVELVVPARREVRLVVEQVGAGVPVDRDDRVPVGVVSLMRCSP